MAREKLASAAQLNARWTASRSVAQPGAVLRDGAASAQRETARPDSSSLPAMNTGSTPLPATGRYSESRTHAAEKSSSCKWLLRIDFSVADEKREERVVESRDDQAFEGRGDEVTWRDVPPGGVGAVLDGRDSILPAP